MRLTNEFVVPLPPAGAWDVLLDVHRVASSFPGASVESVDGDSITGTVNVKLGPVSMTYRGTAQFIDRDTAARRVVVHANGQESRGSGTAAATVTAQLHEAEDGTRVVVDTDLDITGRPAQLGRGVLADVGQRLLDNFADQLAGQITDGAGDQSAPQGGTVPPTAAERRRPEALDLSAVSVGPVVRRAVPVLAAGLAFAAGWIAGRGRKPRRNGFDISLKCRRY